MFKSNINAINFFYNRIKLKSESHTLLRQVCHVSEFYYKDILKLSIIILKKSYILLVLAIVLGGFCFIDLFINCKTLWNNSNLNRSG